MPSLLRVVRWDEFQHYRDRDPVWIKLHRGLLDNYEWARLQDASKSHLIGIWLLAARHGNAVPADPEWIARRIGATGPVDLQPLVRGGFITIDGDAEQDASTALAECLPRERGEREERREEERREEAAANGASNVLADPAELGQQALQGYCRRAPFPEAVRAQVQAAIDGMPGHGPGYPRPVVMQALHEMAAAGASFSALTLTAFCTKVAARAATGTPIEMVTDDNGVPQPATLNPDGSWHFLSAAERQRLLA